MAQTQTQQHVRTTHVNNSIVNLIDNGIIIVDTDLKIYHYNKWIEIQTNKKESDVLFQKITDVFPNINAKILSRKIRTALRMQNATYYTANTSQYLIPIKINQIQNSYFNYMQQDVSIVPYNMQTNQVALIITDQTRMANTHAFLEENIKKVKSLNEELLKEKAITKRQHKELILSSRNAAMGEMISMIAHQWRQPLSVINSSIASLKIKKELDALNGTTLDTTFDKIENTVLFLSETINDFRNYFKPNKISEEINISELFNKSIYFITNEMSNMNIEHQQNIDENITAITHKNELLQSLINIYKNSLDAFQESHVKNKIIQTTVKQIGKNLVISIEDNAGGIDKKILQKVFEPYFSTKSKNGTGLGLYICYTIIKGHLDGDIKIESKNQKTKITIQLPLKEK